MMTYVNHLFFKESEELPMLKKHFKKLVSLALTAVMVMGMSVTSFAAETETEIPAYSVTVNEYDIYVGKNLKVVGGERQAHCEHDDAKDDGLRCAAHPVEGVRQEKGHHGKFMGISRAR